MRGKAWPQTASIDESRITPAYAGKSAASRGVPPPSRDHPPAYAGKSSISHESQFNNRDHPRLCGEKPVADAKPGYAVGSPPPMRGKDLKSPTILTIPFCHSAQFIQFFEHSERQAAIGKRAISAGGIKAEVRCKRGQLIIRNVVELSFGQLQGICIRVSKLGQAAFSAGRFEKSVIKRSIMANDTLIRRKRKEAAHGLIQRSPFFLQHIVLNIR